MTTTEPAPGTDEHLAVILADVAVLSEESDTYGATRMYARPAGEDTDLADELHAWAEARRLTFIAEAALGVLAEVAAERHRQDVKWGEQNHPDGTGDDVRLLADPAQPTYGTLAYLLRAFVDLLHEHHASRWAPILLEEVFEALAENDETKLRVELIQAAAVCVQWAQAIDRRHTPAAS